MTFMLKQNKGHKFQLSKRGTNLQLTKVVSVGLQAIGRGWLTSDQIEECCITINDYLKRKGVIWVYAFPNKHFIPRQGKHSARWVAKVKDGLIFFEISGVPVSQAREAFRLVSNKLGFQTQVVIRSK